MFGQQMGMQGIQTIEKAKGKTLPPKARNLIIESATEVLSEAMEKESFYELYYDIYGRYFTLQDLKEINKFNATPPGKKALKTMPLIMQELMPISQQWAVSLAPEIQKNMMERLKEYKQ